MNARSSIGLALLLIGSTPPVAFANTGPGLLEQVIFSPWLLLPVMVLLSLAGGGYAIRARLRGTGPPRFWHHALRVCGAFAVLFPVFFMVAFIAMMSTHLPVFALLVGGPIVGIALYRAVELLRWGWLARARARAPEYLAAANPWRLLPAGGLLLLLAIFLMGYSILISLNPPISAATGYRLALVNTKTAVTQAIVYAEDKKDVYPTSLKVLRDSGYANVGDKDLWGRDYVLSPVLTQGSKPSNDDDVYIYSRGPEGTGTYPRPFTDRASARGSAGYSSVYGSWGYE